MKMHSPDTPPPKCKDDSSRSIDVLVKLSRFGDDASDSYDVGHCWFNDDAPEVIGGWWQKNLEYMLSDVAGWYYLPDEEEVE